MRAGACPLGFIISRPDSGELDGGSPPPTMPLGRSERREEKEVEFFDVVNARKSIRAYGKDPVPEDKLDRILEAARVAPSAANRQP